MIKVVMSEHAYQRIRERLDDTLDKDAANVVSKRALKKGKSFADFIRVDEKTSRKKLSYLFRHITPDKFLRMYRDRAFVFKKVSGNKVVLVTVLPLQEDGEESEIRV